MSNPRVTHPLDVDLVDLVDGTLDAAVARIVEDHLATCLICRIKRQRISQAPPIDLADLGGVDVPGFEPIEVEQADPAGASAGELWLTAADDAAMVLVTKVRPNGWGLVVVPVVFDTEVGDSGTLVLDETASPLTVPIAIYDGMLNSLPVSALRGRVVPTRQNIDLLKVTDNDPGVSRGTPLEGPADPRHEVRQYINDKVVSAEPLTAGSSEEPPNLRPAHGLHQLDQDAVDARFKELKRAFFDRPDADVLPLSLLDVVPAAWKGIAQIESFNQRILLLVIEGGLPEDRGPARMLCERFHCSAIAVLAQSSSRLIDLYPHSALVGAQSVQTGATLTEPILTGPDTDVIARYLDLMVKIPDVNRSDVGALARVDPKEILGREVDLALTSQVTSGRSARIPAKQEGLTSIGDLASELTEVLRQVFSVTVDPAAVIELADGRDR